MPVEWSEESFYRKEMSKWDRPKRDGGKNRNGFEKFPMMLYRAQRNPMSNQWQVSLERDVISLDKTVVLLSAEQFNATCQITVNDEREYERARADGWSDSMADAMAYHEKLEQEIAVAAAERAHQDRNMSEKAKAEIAVAESKTAEHVAEIKEKRRAAMAKAREAKAAKKVTPPVEA